MYTSEDVNTAALYNLHYTGAAKKTKDSQEQYEALLNNWGFATKNASKIALSKKISTFAKRVLSVLKSSYNMMTASPLLAKQQSANAHISSH